MKMDKGVNLASYVVVCKSANENPMKELRSKVENFIFPEDIKEDGMVEERGCCLWREKWAPKSPWVQ